MKTQVIGTATFKLADTADEARFRETFPETLDFFTDCDGFIRRSIAKGQEGWWVDVTEWSSQEAADVADEKFMADTRNAAFMAHIDPSSVTLHNAQLVAERT